MSIAKIQVVTDRRGNVICAAPTTTPRRRTNHTDPLVGPLADQHAFFVYVPRDKQDLSMRNLVRGSAVAGNR